MEYSRQLVTDLVFKWADEPHILLLVGSTNYLFVKQNSPSTQPKCVTSSLRKCIKCTLVINETHIWYCYEFHQRKSLPWIYSTPKITLSKLNNLDLKFIISLYKCIHCTIKWTYICHNIRKCHKNCQQNWALAEYFMEISFYGQNWLWPWKNWMTLTQNS